MHSLMLFKLTGSLTSCMHIPMTQLFFARSDVVILAQFEQQSGSNYYYYYYLLRAMSPQANSHAGPVLPWPMIQEMVRKTQAAIDKERAMILATGAAIAAVEDKLELEAEEVVVSFSLVEEAEEVEMDDDVLESATKRHKEMVAEWQSLRHAIDHIIDGWAWREQIVDKQLMRTQEQLQRCVDARACP